MEEDLGSGVVNHPALCRIDVLSRALYMPSRLFAFQHALIILNKDLLRARRGLAMVRLDFQRQRHLDRAW